MRRLVNQRPEPGIIHEQSAFSCTEAGSGRHFPERRESIALRSPCSAQALGDHPWSPVRRMRRTPGGSEEKHPCFSRSGKCLPDPALFELSVVRE
jgi:hypothetical protein